MAKKRKTLPKNFSELIEAGKLDKLIEVFDTCELNATGGYEKGTALGFFNVPVELVRWLLSKGADINAVNTYNRTPLHQHAGYYNGDIDIFLESGADIEAVDKYGNTPLHIAVDSSFNAEIVRILVQKGANILAKNDSGDTPLAYALNRASNIDIENLAVVSDILLKAGTPVTKEMQKSTTRIGENFEFHREGFNKEFLIGTDAGLSQLYKMFKVKPVKKRNLHDGISTITVISNEWKDQYNELWDLLIPSSGSANTIQGEVIRITGKVRDEIYRNGGANWDKHFNKMLEALIMHLKSGVPLNKTLLKEASYIIKQVRKTKDGDEELSYLSELAVKWVLANPIPILLTKPDYDR